MERQFALFALWWKFRLQWKGFQGRHTLPWSTSANGCPAAGGRLFWLWSPPCPALSVHTANFSDMKESWFCLNNSTRILCFILTLEMIVESIALQNCMLPSTSLECLSCSWTLGAAITVYPEESLILYKLEKLKFLLPWRTVLFFF